MIEFESILSPSCTHVGVDARSKKGVLEHACECLADAFPEIEPRRLLEGLLARERLGSTGLGEGVAIPHCRFDRCDAPMACFLKTREGIDFDGPDDQLVDLLFVLAVPLHEQRIHLEILGALARAFDDPGNLASLRRAATDQDLFDALQR
ncbi:MAG: PTS sugar transporter subunit IIA, partial [Gammaproteobacteria bacterium]|nr:PTS sugar transporter subunit IIA [Gammaproteobacteria bacterium]